MTRGLGGSGFGSRRDSAPVRVHLAKVKVPLTTVVVAWVLRRLWAGLRFVLLRPLLLAAAAVGAIAARVTVHHGPLPVLLALAVLAAALAVLVAAGAGVVHAVGGVAAAGGVAGRDGVPVLVAAGHGHGRAAPDP